MPTATTEDHIRRIITDHLGVDDDDVRPDSTLDDMSADCLDVIEIVMKFEDDLGIEIVDGLIEIESTVADMVAVIDEAPRR